MLFSYKIRRRDFRHFLWSSIAILEYTVLGIGIAKNRLHGRTPLLEIDYMHILVKLSVLTIKILSISLFLVTLFYKFLLYSKLIEFEYFGSIYSILVSDRKNCCPLLIICTLLVITCYCATGLYAYCIMLNNLLRFISKHTKGCIHLQN